MYTQAARERFIQLRAEGWSYRKISILLKIDPDTLVEWNKKLTNEISEAKKTELKKLMETMGVAKKERILTFARVFNEVKDRLENDIYRQGSEKFVELLLKLDQKIALETALLDGESKKPEGEPAQTAQNQ